jgi:hypothetical protein
MERPGMKTRENGWGCDVGRKRKGRTTFREQYFAFKAFILKSRPQNMEAFTPEAISRVIGCSVHYAYELEAEDLQGSWNRVQESLIKNG